MSLLLFDVIILGVWLILFHGAVSKQKIPRFAMGPFVPIGVLLAYQCDLAYGNKLGRPHTSFYFVFPLTFAIAERVNASFEQILAEKHGITLPKEETKEAKGLVKSA